MKTNLTFLSIIALLLLAIYFLFSWGNGQKSEKERLKVNQDAYGQKIGSLLKTLKSKEFIKYNPNAVNTATANNIKPTQITHYIHVVDSFKHTDTLLIYPEIDLSNEVRSFKIDNKCYNLDLLLLPDTLIATCEPIYDLSLFNYFEYERKTRVGRLIHLNWNKTYTAKCINNCNNAEVKILENIQVER
jgi:hypothetical protein